ncbi:MAG TPA: sigma 54-interacting transcriptional regulator [Myxococcaceae bacterium]|nr:sigma 54-interacting transcriptional regulator [Myxococcaceae bacterium]
MGQLEYRLVRRQTTADPSQRVPMSVPLGPEPRAVRILRPGHAPVVLALAKTREYRLGRSERADLYFEAESVSNEHGALYFCDKAAAWVYRDLGSINGSWATRASPDSRTYPVLPGMPVALIAGYSVELARSMSRLEFLAEIPPEALGAPGTTVWKSKAGKKLEEALAVAAGHPLPLVLIGPSGTGKTYAAKRIHQLSRRPGEFISINCGQLPGDPLHLGSELIGHVKGAFTGADEPRQGKLFAADKGTLFLDEVDALVPEAQAYLLTLLEGREDIVPIGAPMSRRRPRPHFRIICASQKGLKKAGLRADLTERLGADFIHIPRLEERREDIPIFIERLLDVLSAEVHAHVNLSQEALSFLMNRQWPGQVRELHESVQAVVHRRLAEQVRDGIATRSVVLGRGDFERYFDDRIQGMDGDGTASESAASLAPSPPISKRPKNFTAQDVQGALHDTRGNKTHAARLLGIALNTLKRKMKEFGLWSGDGREPGQQ